MQKLDRLVSKVVLGLNFMSSMVLLFMLIFIVIYIVLRAVFSYAIFGTFEIVQLACMTLVACALAGNDYSEGNITVPVLVEMMPKTLRYIVEGFALVLTSALCVCFSVLLYKNMFARIATNAVTSNLELPIWIFTLILFVSFILLSFSALCRTAKHFARYTGKENVEEDLAANL